MLTIRTVDMWILAFVNTFLRIKQGKEGEKALSANKGASSHDSSGARGRLRSPGIRRSGKKGHPRVKKRLLSCVLLPQDEIGNTPVSLLADIIYTHKHHLEVTKVGNSQVGGTCVSMLQGRSGKHGSTPGCVPSLFPVCGHSAIFEEARAKHDRLRLKNKNVRLEDNPTHCRRIKLS